MSLRRLMNSYMTIQTSEGAIQDSDGALIKEGNWVILEDFKNVKCNIQEKSRMTVTDRFSRLDEEGVIVAYHTNERLYTYRPNTDSLNQTVLRVITNRISSTRVLSFPVSDEDIRIYTFMGHIEQIQSVRRRFQFFILRLERTDMWVK